MFLIRGAGLLNVLREAQMCGRSPNWLGGSGGMLPRKFFEKLMLRDQFWCNLSLFTLHCTENVASFPGLPRFRFSVCVQYNTRRRFAFSIIHGGASVYYTQRKPKNENGGGLGTRLLRIKALKCQTLVIVRHKPRLHVSCNLGMRQEPGSA